MKQTGICIPSLDAKDVFISNVLFTKGYSLERKDGNANLKRYINTLDYSLDSIKLREVYEKVYRNKKFSFFENDKEFTPFIVNLTFKYSNKRFNKISSTVIEDKESKKDKQTTTADFYVKYGHNITDDKLKDSICIKRGKLVAIKTNFPVENPVDNDLLEKCFVYKNGCYRARNIPTLHTTADLRSELYNNGFMCGGRKYVRFKRSSGSSRVGKCLFIDEKLYSRMHKNDLLGIKVTVGQEIDLAALEAYIALTLSSIIDTIKIKPENILVIDDYESVFKDTVIATRVDEQAKRLKTQKETVDIVNSIWDGESLIDKSLMGKYDQYGMILLRKNFFKSCCFNTNIQEFFKNNGITSIKQLNGFTLAKNIEDVKLITTPSSIKFLKFGTLEEWLSRIDSTFGIVKHEKKTHFFEGRMVQTHYQLLNTLELSKNEVAELLKPTFDYMDKLKRDPAVLRYHVHYPEDYTITNRPLLSKNDIVFKLLGLNEEFSKTQWYSEFRRKNIDSYRSNLRYGHVLVNGNYSTLLGNPLEMLQHSIGKFNGESTLGVGNIHSTRFKYGERILGSRSPHVCIGNVLLTNNVAHPEIDKYFNLTDEIVCVNSINENLLQRLSGADFDSDTILLTNNELLISSAEKNYDRFLVPTSLVESTKAKRYYTTDQQCDLDVKTSVNLIGEIINLSQELQSLMWDRLSKGETYEDVEDLYFDICQLDIMSNVEIDRAKKEFVIDNKIELNDLKTKWERRDEQDRIIKPYFFGHIAQTKGYYNPDKKNYMHHATAMDYLEELVDKYRSPVVRGKKMPLTDILDDSEFSPGKVYYAHIDAILDELKKYRNKVKSLWTTESIDVDNKMKHQLYIDYNNDMVRTINKKINPNIHTLLVLLKKLESEDYKEYKRHLSTILFNIKNQSAFQLIQNSNKEVPMLVPDENGDINLYGLRYSKTYKK